MVIVHVVTLEAHPEQAKALALCGMGHLQPGVW